MGELLYIISWGYLFKVLIKQIFMYIYIYLINFRNAPVTKDILPHLSKVGHLIYQKSNFEISEDPLTTITQEISYLTKSEKYFKS